MLAFNPLDPKLNLGRRIGPLAFSPNNQNIDLLVIQPKEPGARDGIDRLFRVVIDIRRRASFAFDDFKANLVPIGIGRVPALLT